jgi:cytoskeletal protein CcmA (bactofilin family)
MTTHTLNIRSEKGIALIMVLLLLGVMAALTTGLALNGQTEVAMSANETYYAGARSAAEGGMNRAVNQILADTATDLLATGVVPVIGNGPFALNTQFSYSFQILDDDDPALYNGVALSADQLLKMGEDGDPTNDVNTRMILQSIGTGPKSTSVTVARVLQSTEIPDIPETKTIISNPALLVNGDVELGGNAKILGTRGNVHANGDIVGAGSSVEVSGDVTATGDVDIDFTPGGLSAGNMPEIAVPEIKASDYFNLADWVLTSTGTITHADGSLCGLLKSDPCPSGWSYSVTNGRWEAQGSMPTSATYYAQGDVYMKGTGGSGLTQLSVIAEGSIKLEGNGKFKPENGAGIQFVTNGDFELGGTVDADDTVDFDGQIMVREQLKLDGTAEFQGRVMVEDRDSATNVYNAVTNPNGRRGTNKFDTNSVSGNLTLTYNGSLGDIVTTITLPPGPSTYTNNISGWLEQ